MIEGLRLPDPPQAGPTHLVSYHYDALMRLRRIKLWNTLTNEEFFLAPGLDEGGQLILVREER